MAEAELIPIRVVIVKKRERKREQRVSELVVNLGEELGSSSQVNTFGDQL